MKEFIEIPFGAKDSELCGWEYTIPKGFVASIENGKIIVKKEENKDENVRKSIIGFLKTIASLKDGKTVSNKDFDSKALLEWAAWLEKQGKSKFEQSIQDGDNIVTNDDGTHFNVSQLERVAKKEPNSAWSEEDEENLNKLHKLIVEKAYREYEIDTEDETLYGKWLKLDNWLKSLKERLKGE